MKNSAYPLPWSWWLRPLEAQLANRWSSIGHCSRGVYHSKDKSIFCPNLHRRPHRHGLAENSTTFPLLCQHWLQLEVGVQRCILREEPDRFWGHTLGRTPPARAPSRQLLLPKPGPALHYLSLKYSSTIFQGTSFNWTSFKISHSKDTNATISSFVIIKVAKRSRPIY